jgi:hypothetical protein
MPPLNIASQYRHTHRAATTSPVRCLVRDSQITSSFEPQIGQLGGSRNAIPTVQIKQKGYRSVSFATVVLFALGCGSSSTAPTRSDAQTLTGAQAEYRDPDGRFTFMYPQSFGVTSIGTNNGFGNRAAAVRFSVFSSQGIGGEAVLTQNRLSLDVQAAGGLYDDIASEALPDSLKRTVDAALPALTVANLCEQLGREHHLDVSAPLFASLAREQRAALMDLDATGNVAPVVTRCAVSGDTVTFEKEAAPAPGAPRRRTYGVVRFLTGRYIAFQLLRAGGSTSPSVIAEMEAVARSVRLQ